MRNIFLQHIYVMYSEWFAAGVILLGYIAYRRKRKAASHPANASTSENTTQTAH